MTWRLFGGKGGVGKSTCAAAWAVSRADAGDRVLLVSTDPAHSLADVFAARAAPVNRHRSPRAQAPVRFLTTRAGLVDGLEIDAPRAVAGWLQMRRPVVARLLERGTLLDREDIYRILALPLPGLDELAAFLAMTALERAGRYDVFAIDTAPTGHALRLFDLPRLVQALAELFEAMHARHALIADALGGAVRPDALVEELRGDAAAVERRLHDAATTTFCWVTLPEVVAVQETLDGIDWLRRGRFPLRELIVNRLTRVSRSGRCAECRGRAQLERAALRAVADKAASLRVRAIPRFDAEPRGIPALRRIAADLRRSATWRELTARPAAAGRRRKESRRPATGARSSPVLAEAVVPDSVRLVFFGGKGGVGKTTCAAATAVRIASRTGGPVRIISTDPAPSLGDVFGLAIGDSWRPVEDTTGLEARELDAAAVFDRFRHRYRAAIDAFFDDLSGGSAFDAPADRAVFQRLLELAPPGLDEIMALVAVADLTGEGSQAVLIVDTAPTGHTVRLLGLHADVQRWIALLMQLIVKYRLAARAESFAQDLIQLSRGLRALRALLQDPTRARFVVVTRPGVLPRLETERLVAELRAMKIAAPLLIVNAETGGTCRACEARAKEEQREVMRLRRLCRGPARRCDIMHAPLRLPPPRGAAALLEWSSRWRVEPVRSPRRKSRN